jgi:hypothetical protein
LLDSIFMKSVISCLSALSIKIEKSFFWTS